MPFCTNCGNKVADTDAFCQRCGSRQTMASARSTPRPPTDFLDSMSDRTACILCYIPVAGIVPAIVFLASQRFRKNPRVRFDAFQSLYLFVAWLLLTSAFPTFFIFGVQQVLLASIKVAFTICWVYLLIKAAQNEQIHLPLLGDLAAKSTAEQV